MLDHDARSYDDIAQAFVDGHPVDGLTRDEVLDNIRLTWLTNTGISSAPLYWENKVGSFDIKGVKVPSCRQSRKARTSNIAMRWWPRI